MSSREFIVPIGSYSMKTIVFVMIIEKSSVLIDRSMNVELIHVRPMIYQRFLHSMDLGIGQQNGWYADIENQCRVYYLCTEQRKSKMGECPAGSKWNSQRLRCDDPRNILSPCKLFETLIHCFFVSSRWITYKRRNFPISSTYFPRSSFSINIPTNCFIENRYLINEDRRYCTCNLCCLEIRWLMKSNRRSMHFSVLINWHSSSSSVFHSLFSKKQTYFRIFLLFARMNIHIQKDQIRFDRWYSRSWLLSKSIDCSACVCVVFL